MRTSEYRLPNGDIVRLSSLGNKFEFDISEPHSGYDYIIFKDDDGYVYAKNGKTGKVEFKDEELHSLLTNLTNSIPRLDSYMINGHGSILPDNRQPKIISISFVPNVYELNGKTILPTYGFINFNGSRINCNYDGICFESNPYYNFTNGSYWSPFGFLKITNGIFVGNWNNLNSELFKLNGISDITFDNIKFYHFHKAGIHIIDGYNHVLTNINAQYNEAPIFLESSDNISKKLINVDISNITLVTNSTYYPANYGLKIEGNGSISTVKLNNAWIENYDTTIYANNVDEVFLISNVRLISKNYGIFATFDVESVDSYVIFSITNSSIRGPLHISNPGQIYITNTGIDNTTTNPTLTLNASRNISLNNVVLNYSGNSNVTSEIKVTEGVISIRDSEFVIWPSTLIDTFLSVYSTSLILENVYFRVGNQGVNTMLYLQPYTRNVVISQVKAYDNAHINNAFLVSDSSTAELNIYSSKLLSINITDIAFACIVNSNVTVNDYSKVFHDTHMYTSLPLVSDSKVSGIFLNRPIHVHDVDGSITGTPDSYWIFVWDGSTWRKTQLS